MLVNVFNYTILTLHILDRLMGIDPSKTLSKKKLQLDSQIVEDWSGEKSLERNLANQYGNLVRIHCNVCYGT